jgi:acyl carrier protein
MAIQKEIIVQQLVQYLQTEILDQPVALDEHQPFAEMGVESYAVIQLVLYIERKFGVELPESDLTSENLKSIETIATCTAKYL